jgi:hypothetical protein
VNSYIAPRVGLLQTTERLVRIGGLLAIHDDASTRENVIAVSFSACSVRCLALERVWCVEMRSIGCLWPR